MSFAVKSVCVPVETLAEGISNFGPLSAFSGTNLIMKSNSSSAPINICPCPNPHSALALFIA